MNSRHVLLLFLVISCAVGIAQTTLPAAPQVTVIRAGTLIDPRADEPKHNQVIVIRGERIEAVGDAASVKVPAGANVIDLSNATVLPGLIESHTHIFLQGEDPAKGGYDIQLLKFYPSYRAARATVSARRALEQGFTTIRDMETEGAGYGDVGIKQAINEGIIPGPRIFAATRGISTTGGYPLEGYAPGVEVPKGVQIVDGPVEARKAAREQLDYGADWIKVYMTHRSWVDKDGKLVSQPTLTVEELQGDRRRGAWMEAQSGVPRLQRRRPASRARRRMRLHRARAAAGRRSDCADEAAGDVVLPDALGVLHRLVTGEHAGRQARPGARRRSRAVVQEGRAGGIANRLRD